MLRSREELRQRALAWLAAEIPAFAARVAPVYKLLNWKWNGSRHESAAIPTEEDIIKSLMERLETLNDPRWKDEPEVSARAGGLEVFIGFEEPKDNPCEARLAMNITEVDWFYRDPADDM